MEQSQFSFIPYQVGIYRTISEPYLLCVNIENSSNVQAERVSLSGRLYIYRKHWYFSGPRKAVYSAIISLMINWKIHPVYKEEKNPTHKAYFALPVDRYNDIERIIESVVRGITISQNGESTYRVETNLTEDVNEAIDTGILYTFNRNPSAIVLQTGVTNIKKSQFYDLSA